MLGLGLGLGLGLPWNAKSFSRRETDGVEVQLRQINSEASRRLLDIVHQHHVRHVSLSLDRGASAFAVTMRTRVREERKIEIVWF